MNTVQYEEEEEEEEEEGNVYRYTMSRQWARPHLHLAAQVRGLLRHLDVGAAHAVHLQPQVACKLPRLARAGGARVPAAGTTPQFSSSTW